MGHERYFSDSAFRKKLSEIGSTLREHAIVLYVLFMDEDTPAWVKIAIIAALGYFICPWDAIPDFIFGAGYADDLAVLAAVVAKVKAFITPQLRAKADAWR